MKKYFLSGYTAGGNFLVHRNISSEILNDVLINAQAELSTI